MPHEPAGRPQTPGEARDGVGGRFVYVIEHDDRWYEMGDSYVRSVHATREGAIAARVVKSRNPDNEHNESCCSVVEREVQP